MIRSSRFGPILVAIAALLVFWGCDEGSPPEGSDPGTSSTVQIPESDPPILSPEVAKRIDVGMPQDKALEILLEAARETASARSMMEFAVKQSHRNPIRFDLTVTQGKRSLILNFKSSTLILKKPEGLE